MKKCCSGGGGDGRGGPFSSLRRNINRTHGRLRERNMSRTNSKNLTCLAEWMVKPFPEKESSSKLCLQTLPNTTLLFF